MLEQFFNEYGIYYVIAALCSLGVLAKCYESRMYAGFLNGLDNQDRKEHPFLKQLKDRYKHYHTLERKIHNMDAFVETSLYRYKKSLSKMERLQSLNRRLMLLCFMISCGGVALCVHFHGDRGMATYYALAGGLSVAGLKLVDLQAGISHKKKMLMTLLKDYLENSLANQLEGSGQEHARQQAAVTTDEERAAKKEEVTRNIAEKVASELASDKVIAEVIKEFFP